MRIVAASRVSRLACVLAALLATSGMAEVVAQVTSTGRTWPVEIGTMADSVGFVPGIPHPLVSLGTEIPWDNRGVFRLVQSVQLDYRVHFLHGPGVNTRLIARWMANVGVFGEVGLGVGYLMGFYAPGTWTLDNTTGEFVAGGNSPRSIFRATLGVGVGLDLSVRWDVPLRVMAAYDETILFNVAPEAGWPIIPAPAYGIRLAWFFGGAQ
jgi:hypothetical protein